MFSEYNTNSNYINLPYRLAKRYRYDRRKWDLLVFAVCLKLNSGDSGLYIESPRTIMNLFHCSYRKAERLINHAAHNADLFRYNPKTKFLTARAFKHGCGWYEDKFNGKRKLYADSCIVIEKRADGTISHFEISHQLRDNMMLKQISRSSSSDDLHSQHPYRSEARKPLTQQYIGNIAGCHQTTVSRHLRKLASREVKRISITSHEKIAVYDIEHGVEYRYIPNRRPFYVGHTAYIRDVNDYTILDESIHYRFKHIIYNHPKRKTDNRSNYAFAQFD